MKISSLDKFHSLALFALFSNAIYLIWLSFNITGVLGDIFLLFEIMTIAIIPLFIFNHWRRKYQFLGGSYSFRSSVDVFIPTVDEPADMLKETIIAAKQISHPRIKIFVLDDGSRSKIKALCSSLGVSYITRPSPEKKAYKAANLNYAMTKTTGDFVLIIDADNVVSPNILDDLLGHFSDKNVGIVASRQSFDIPKNDFNHDHLFYNSMQNGKNSDGAAISCGSGVIYRRSALESIKGFSEWNLVEDLFTTYVANSQNIKSVYVSQSYVLGHAPQDIKSIYKQRGTWAVDTLRMFFWRPPILNRHLSTRQRLHYFELGYCYIVSGVALAGIYIVNFAALTGNIPIVENGYIYLLLRIPAMIFTLMFFDRLSQGQLTSRVWAGLFPVYFKALLMAITTPFNKPKYTVTAKTSAYQRDIKRVLVQIIFLLVGYACLLINVFLYGLSPMFFVSGLWIIFMTYWLSPIILKGLNVGSYSYKNTNKIKPVSKLSTA